MRAIKLSPDLQNELIAIAKAVSAPAGKILFHAGEPGRGAFLIRSGKVRMRLGGSGLYPARLFGDGSVIGLPASFSGESYSLTAQAVRDSDLYFIPRSKLLNLLKQKPGAGYEIVRILSEEIFQMRKAAHKFRRASHRRPAATKSPRRQHV